MIGWGLLQVGLLFDSPPPPALTKRYWGASPGSCPPSPRCPLGGLPIIPLSIGDSGAAQKGVAQWYWGLGIDMRSTGTDLLSF